MGLALASIFIGFHEKSLLYGPELPEVYFHYIDDTFYHFNNEIEADLFITSLNRAYPALKITLRKTLF